MKKGKAKGEYPKYVWAVVGDFKGCLDIRRYAFGHLEALAQLRHCIKDNQFLDVGGEGVWTLFKLVQVNKRRPR